MSDEKRTFRRRLLLLNGALALVLAGTYWGNRAEVAAIRPDLLSSLRLPFRGWNTSDRGLTPQERGLLEPDAVLLRTYRGKNGQFAELAVIAGSKKKTVHTPGFCMAGGGWEIVRQERGSLRLSEREVPLTRMLLEKSGERWLVTYFFTDGDFSTTSLIRFQGAQLLKRLQTKVPFGALVRTIVPVLGEDVAARKLADEFTRATVPSVLDRLRQPGSGAQAMAVTAQKR